MQRGEDDWREKSLRARGARPKPRGTVAPGKSTGQEGRQGGQVVLWQDSRLWREHGVSS